MAPKLKTLAARINDVFVDLVATIEPGYCNTDRPIHGTRLRHPGKGRHGTKLVVKERATGRVVFEHNAAETYRYNGEVVDWIRRRAQSGTQSAGSSKK